MHNILTDQEIDRNNHKIFIIIKMIKNDETRTF